MFQLEFSTLSVDTAETEILAIAIRVPSLWAEVCHVRHEWFRSTSRQTLWAAIQHSYAVNGGLTEHQVLVDWFRENCDASEIEGLARELVACADAYLHAEYLGFYLQLLRHAGQRLAIQRWAQQVIQLCRNGRAIASIHKLVMSPPIDERGTE